MKIPEQNLVFLFVGLFLAGFLLLEGVASLRNGLARRLCVILISGALIVWLDWFSFLSLLGLSTALLYLTRLGNDFVRKHIVKIFFLLAATLLGVKDYGHFLPVETVYVPLGVSYYFFRLISFVIDVSTKKIDPRAMKTIDYYTYVFFFPLFLAGPIQRFVDFNEIEHGRVMQERPRYYRIIIVSLLVKIFLVDSILFEIGYHELYPRMYLFRGAGALLFLSAFGLCTFLHAYLDLMLYTEMSKSVAGLLGFTVQDNFNRPLLATNISMFWQRWHMSLSNWTRDYVFFPALVKTRNTSLSTYLSMLTIGLWHAATLSWMAWAVAHATAINLYGVLKRTGPYRFMLRGEIRRRALGIAGNVATVAFVSLIFTVVAAEDFVDIIIYLSSIFSP